MSYSSEGAPVEVFRSHSSIEADVVRGLLDAHGIGSTVSSALSRSVFPVRFGQTQFRVAVNPSSAATARELIASHLDEQRSTLEHKLLMRQ